MLFSNFKDTTSLRVTMQQVISTTYKYTSKKENAPTNRGLFHDFRFSLGYDNLQQDGISEAVGSLTVFLHTAGKGASCPYCGHFSHRLHSYYSRHIEDLEVYGHTLELVIKLANIIVTMFLVHKKYSANRCLFWLVGMVDGAILLRNASDR